MYVRAMFKKKKKKKRAPNQSALLGHEALQRCFLEKFEPAPGADPKQ